MDITYLGHSSFKLRGKNATVVTDPYESKVGFAMPSVSADLVTVSHDHFDHNAISFVSGTSRRDKPYVVTAPGEYEVGGVGVFGWATYHDNKQGEERGKNTVYSIHIDGVRVVHLGDLGHTLDDTVIEGLGTVDVLLVPVGGVYTIDAEEAKKVIEQLEPAYVIPMHYRTDKHNDSFAKVAPLQDFLTLMGKESLVPQERLRLMGGMDGMEETEIVVLQV